MAYPGEARTKEVIPKAKIPNSTPKVFGEFLNKPAFAVMQVQNPNPESFREAENKL